MDAAEMINRCFRGTYQELYADRACVEEPVIPSILRNGDGVGDIPVVEDIPEEMSGYPDAIALMGASMMEAELLRAQQESGEAHVDPMS